MAMRRRSDVSVLSGAAAAPHLPVLGGCGGVLTSHGYRLEHAGAHLPRQRR